jgi:hypothetical protein
MSDTMIAAAAYLDFTQQVKKKKRRRWWNRELFAQQNLSQESFWSQLNADDGALFKNFTRMSLTDFHCLLNKVAPFISKQDTNYRNSVPASVRLLITLRFLASGDSNRSLMYLFKVSDSTTYIYNCTTSLCGSSESIKGSNKGKFFFIINKLLQTDNLEHNTYIYSKLAYPTDLVLSKFQYLNLFVIVL